MVSSQSSWRHMASLGSKELILWVALPTAHAKWLRSTDSREPGGEDWLQTHHMWASQVMHWGLHVLSPPRSLGLPPRHRHLGSLSPSNPWSNSEECEIHLMALVNSPYPILLNQWLFPTLELLQTYWLHAVQPLGSDATYYIRVLATYCIRVLIFWGVWNTSNGTAQQSLSHTAKPMAYPLHWSSCRHISYVQFSL